MSAGAFNQLPPARLSSAYQGMDLIIPAGLIKVFDKNCIDGIWQVFVGIQPFGHRQQRIGLMLVERVNFEGPDSGRGQCRQQGTAGKHACQYDSTLEECSPGMMANNHGLFHFCLPVYVGCHPWGADHTP